jgi:hypothetical protein
MDLIFFETPEDKGVYHIHHGTPYGSDEYKVRIANGKSVFNSRNKLGIISLVIKMFARHMREKREARLIGGGYDKV